jgi:hypothetical protein
VLPSRRPTGLQGYPCVRCAVKQVVAASGKGPSPARVVVGVVRASERVGLLLSMEDFRGGACTLWCDGGGTATSLGSVLAKLHAQTAGGGVGYREFAIPSHTDGQLRRGSFSARGEPRLNPLGGDGDRLRMLLVR